MRLLPYLECRIDSEKSSEEISVILQSVTDSKKTVFSHSDHGEFIGEVNPFGFKISSNINYRNSFLPVIKGNIREGEEGAVIDVQMRLHPITQAFLTVWFAMAGLFSLLGILCVITAGTEEIMLLFFSGGLIISGQLLVRCGFYIPARKSIQRLEELLGEAKNG